MKLLVKQKLIWQDRNYWVLSSTSKVHADYPKHDSFLVIPCQTYTTEKHSYSRVLLVPKGEYAIEFHPEIEINAEHRVTGENEPEWPSGVVDERGRFIPDKELTVHSPKLGE